MKWVLGDRRNNFPMKLVLGLLTLTALALAQCGGVVYVETYTNGQFNQTAVWLAPGQLAVIYADPVVDFGNGTKLVFKGWSDGSKLTRRVVGPGIYYAQYYDVSEVEKIRMYFGLGAFAIGAIAAIAVIYLVFLWYKCRGC